MMNGVVDADPDSRADCAQTNPNSDNIAITHAADFSTLGTDGRRRHQAQEQVDDACDNAKIHQLEAGVEGGLDGWLGSEFFDFAIALRSVAHGTPLSFDVSRMRIPHVRLIGFQTA